MSKTAEILQKLEAGVQSLLKSDTYKQYLTFLSTFRTYSARNTVLIFSQCPHASLLAPYREWQSRHRHVRRGEKGIAVIAPHTYKTKTQDSEEPRLGFHVAYTYDVSQTDPDDEAGEIPSVCHRLTGSLDDLSLLDVLVAVSPVPVSFRPIDGDANGYYDRTALEIVVDSTNASVQQAKTLTHEIAHAWHALIDPDFDTSPREDREVIAESVAYVVCSYLGIDASDYSFGYVGVWGGSDMKKFQHNLGLIKKISDDLISEITNHEENRRAHILA